MPCGTTNTRQLDTCTWTWLTYAAPLRVHQLLPCGHTYRHWPYFGKRSIASLCTSPVCSLHVSALHHIGVRKWDRTILREVQTVRICILYSVIWFFFSLSSYFYFLHIIFFETHCSYFFGGVVGYSDNSADFSVWLDLKFIFVIIYMYLYSNYV